MQPVWEEAVWLEKSEDASVVTEVVRRKVAHRFIGAGSIPALPSLPQERGATLAYRAGSDLLGVKCHGMWASVAF